MVSSLCTIALLCWPLETGLQKIAIEAMQFKRGSHFIEVPDRNITGRLAVDIDIRIAGPLYWKNRVFTLAGDSGVEWVGYHYELGLELWRKHLEIFFEQHASEHPIGRSQPNHFPVYDGWGLRYTVFTL